MVAKYSPTVDQAVADAVTHTSTTGISMPKTSAEQMMDTAVDVPMPAGLDPSSSLSGDANSGFAANFGTVAGYTEDNMGR